MKIDDARVFDIPINELQGVDDLVFQTLQMDRDMVMEEFDDIFEDTNERCLESLACKGMYRSFPIAINGADEVCIGQDSTMKSAFLSEMLNLADEIVLYAVTVHGYEELSKDPSNSPFDGMFYDAWAVAYAMSCHRWIQQAIHDDAAGRGLFVGRGWAPGDGGFELSLQKDMLNLLDASRIGIELPESGLMHPVMSISGVMGISTHQEIENVGLDVVGYH